MQKTLKQLGLKDVQPCRFNIVEDKHASLHLARTWDGELYEIMGLYRVTMPDGRDVFVIAEDSAGAISQASSEDITGIVVVRLPFIVRGWGHTPFMGINESKEIPEDSWTVIQS
jgi:hypothetical protein